MKRKNESKEAKGQISHPRGVALYLAAHMGNVRVVLTVNGAYVSGPRPLRYLCLVARATEPLPSGAGAVSGRGPMLTELLASNPAAAEMLNAHCPAATTG